jgi:hypothetical protein
MSICLGSVDVSFTIALRRKTVRHKACDEGNNGLLPRSITQWIAVFRLSPKTAANAAVNETSTDPSILLKKTFKDFPMRLLFIKLQQFFTLKSIGAEISVQSTQTNLRFSPCAPCSYLALCLQIFFNAFKNLLGKNRWGLAGGRKSRIAMQAQHRRRGHAKSMR